MNEIKVDTEELSEYLYDKLISVSLIPTGNDVEVLANIFFNYLIQKDIIEEINLDNNEKFKENS
ncbi:YozD family protein [Priestia megaterium]|uniref:YozD family protein n=1 Tax=Priestia megaterium TaxID=1404 RepID=UPI000BFC7F5C|nr:YozD family protein [Priestia megaterium]PGQ88156.1 YozD family protein [Priestia megaterium]